MGKMLIIRGASFSPSTGWNDDNSNNNNDNNNNQGNNQGTGENNPTPQPPASQTPYTIYYLSGSTWYLNRPSSGAVSTVGLAFNDYADLGIQQVNMDFSAMGISMAFIFATLSTDILDGDSFPEDQANYAGAKQLSASTDVSEFQNYPRALIILANGNTALTGSQIDNIVAAVPTAISFVTD